MEIHLDLITGVMFGIEIVNEDDLVHIVIDMGILRLLISY
jgi:hypothetical protein